MTKRIALPIALSLALAGIAQQAPAKDFYIRLEKGSNLVLTSDRCGMEQIVGAGWQHSEVHITIQTTARVMTLDLGCWKRIGDKVYVLDEAAPFWIAPDGTGGSMYYQLDTQPCSFKVPGVSFDLWRNGKAIAVLTKKEDAGGFAETATVSEYGPMCWRFDSGWPEQISEPQIFSETEVLTSPLP